MKYLRKYNENELDDFRSKTGYSEQELKDIFMLNLEDNDKFDISDISVKSWVIPVADKNFDVGIGIIVELTEDFSNNQEFLSLHTLKHEWAKALSKGNRYIDEYISNVNKKLVDIIGRKYDLEINIIELSHESAAKLNVEFSVRNKNNK